MKVQPLNQTALQVSWSKPETIYHPPIMNYIISYSWTKNEDEKEKTFTKDSDKDLVKLLVLTQGPAALAARRRALCRSLGCFVCHPSSMMPPAGRNHHGPFCHSADAPVNWG